MEPRLSASDPIARVKGLANVAGGQVAGMSAVGVALYVIGMIVSGGVGKRASKQKPYA